MYPISTLLSFRSSVGTRRSAHVNRVFVCVYSTAHYSRYAFANRDSTTLKILTQWRGQN